MKTKYIVTGMTCSACAVAVEKAIKQLGGIEKIEIDVISGRVFVESKQAKVGEILNAVSLAGYGITEMRSTGSVDMSNRVVLSSGQAQQDNSVLARQNDKGSATRTVSRSAQIPINMSPYIPVRGTWLEVATSLVILIVLMYLAMGDMVGLSLPSFFSGSQNALALALSQFLLTLPILLLNRTFFERGWRSLRQGFPTMDTLVALGSGAAFVGGIISLYRLAYATGLGDVMTIQHEMHQLYFDSAAMILVLVRIGKLLEERSKRKTTDAVASLLKLQPAVCTRFEKSTGIWHEVPTDVIKIGDRLKVRAGETIAVDGSVLQGVSTIDESMLTGESMPVTKQKGDELSGGTLNLEGVLEYEATAVGATTRLAQIISLVEEATMSKAPIARMADKIASVFVPVVMTIAGLAFAVWMLVGKPFDFSLNLAIAVLVISCPCALGLATPVAITVGMGRGAKRGLLIKSATALETIGRIDTIVFDKTGTITTGKMAVKSVLPQADVSPEELLQLVATVEYEVTHPVARAVVEYCTANKIEPLGQANAQVVPGHGVSAKFAGKNAWAGNLNYIKQFCHVPDKTIALADKEAQLGATALYFACQERLYGVIIVADKVAPTSPATVKSLDKLGLETVLLTGDHQLTAQTIAAEVGIKTVFADVSPECKGDVIRRLQEQGKRVAMVGDGINDAPALALADVGIAIGAGTDVAIETADIVLQRSNPLDVVDLVLLSQATLRNVKGNLFWAFFYNVLGIPVACGLLFPFFGILLNPMIAAFAMSMSSLFVVGNALRLYRFQFSASSEGCSTTKEVHLNTQTYKFYVMGMACGHCTSRVQKSLEAFAGVNAEMSLEEGTAVVTFSSETKLEELIAAVESNGYEVKEVELL